MYNIGFLSVPAALCDRYFKTSYCCEYFIVTKSILLCKLGIIHVSCLYLLYAVSKFTSYVTVVRDEEKMQIIVKNELSKTLLVYLIF